MSSDFSKMNEYYKDLYDRHGDSSKSLGWNKGNQFLRFDQLTKDWDLNNSSILDVGCGFGDFVSFLLEKKTSNFHYLGVDLSEDFIRKANTNHRSKKITFIKGDFLNTAINSEIDYAVASGTFNFKIEGLDGYEYIYNSMKKMFKLSKKAISIDFLSERVDYFHDHNFNSDPMKILEMAYSLSKRVVLNNSIFPFEFAITIFKDDTFKDDEMIFSKYQQL
jgi:SAM-dependent methyltransferase